MIAAEISAMDGALVVLGAYFVLCVVGTACLCLGAVFDRYSTRRRRRNPEGES